MSQSKNKGGTWKVVLFVVSIILLAGIGFGAFLFTQVDRIAKSLPDPQQTSNWQVVESTKIYDRTGKILLYEINSEGKRTIIPKEDIPDYMKKATIAIEDQDFYNHSALSFKALLRAVVQNILHRRVVQGGSTITQQLAKNAFLTPEKTIDRKIREAILSYWIEQHYTKDEILGLYLNQILYGSASYGVEAASQTYFGKSVRELGLNEFAALASMPQSPTYYSPWGTHQKELLERKDYVLEQMNKLGFIDEQEMKKNQGVKPVFTEPNIGTIKAPHFVMMVKDQLLDSYGEDVVNKSGLKVITTLDWDFQQAAEKHIREGVERNKKLYNGKNAALVAQDPKTGQILALVGSVDYFDKTNDGNFNVAAQGLRQPGSSFKPLAYLTAFSKGFSPNTILFDLPTEFSDYTDICPFAPDYRSDKKECFHPENFDHEFRGPISMRNSLAQSINVTAVKTLYLAGLKDTIQTAKSLGITTLKDGAFYGLSLVLGGGEVKLIDMVNAYSVFSQEGMKHKQSLVLSVEDKNGTMLEKFIDKSVQVIEPQYARLINDILSDSEARRPLFQNSFSLTLFDGREVALKTGTTNDYKDAWTIGYTPNIVVGVWAGNNHQESMQRQGGSLVAAIPIWSAFMKEILPKMPSEMFTRPENTASSKPMLNGEFIYNNEVKSILFYVDKTNPSGPFPQNPFSDPQFDNWDYPIQSWWGLQQRLIGASTTPIVSTSSQVLRIP